MAKAIMVMGTASDVGKSVIAAGLCRLLYRKGIHVAPFKAQNMSLNSFVTLDGGEMGRAQVLQAEACGLSPHVDMNPILLKPESDTCSQVIVHGKVWAKHDARKYFARHEELVGFIEASYRRLARAHEVIVIEGAGSAAEVNLRDKDLVNWPVAEMANADVLLVADIDRGGVFAQVIGTLDLLGPAERRRVVGVIINKFRGDRSLFADGVVFLENRTGLPIIGVIPFDRDLRLDQEDSLEIERYRHTPFTANTVNIAVVLLPHMSNFTDFNALAAEPDVALRYVAAPSELRGTDAVILPGSKNTIANLDDLLDRGFDAALDDHLKAGGELAGICAGLQMLGRAIADPHGVESGGERRALGLLDVITELAETKHTAQVVARPINEFVSGAGNVRGYEIHMGRTERGADSPCFEILQRTGSTKEFANVANELLDGAVSGNGLVWGTYIHGVFDSPGFRRQWLNRIRARKVLEPLAVSVSERVSARLTATIDRWANHLERHLNMTPILSGIAAAHPCSAAATDL